MLFYTNGLFAFLTLQVVSFTFVTCQTPQNSENCTTVNNIEHCFITTSGGTDVGLKPWQAAKDLCSIKLDGGLYSLPVLDNDDIRTALERYMVQQELYPESVWTAGRVERLLNYTWLDGTPYSGFNPLPLNRDELRAAKMKIIDNNGNIIFTNNSVVVQEKLICHFTDRSICDEFRGPSTVVSPPGFFQSPTDNSSCYVIFPRHSNYVKSTQKWYTARNICLQKNGDLADMNITLVDGMRLTNFLENNVDYYVGLRQHRLVWDPSNGNMSEIRKTYFEGNAPTARVNATCIAVRLSGQWVWETRNCQDVLQVVCHKATPITVSSTTQPKSDDDKVPHVSYGGMIGIAIGACIFFVLAIVAAVLLTYFIIKRSRSRPREDSGIYADNVHNGRHHCNHESDEDKEDYVNVGQTQDENSDSRNPYGDGGSGLNLPPRTTRRY